MRLIKFAIIVVRVIYGHQRFGFLNICHSSNFISRYEYDDPEFKQLTDMMSMFFESGGFANPERFIPLLTPIIPLINVSFFFFVNYKSLPFSLY